MANAPVLIVDFNRADDDDVVWGVAAAWDAQPDMAIELHDREGNRCLGYVVKVEGGKVYAQMVPSTWVDASPVQIEQEPGDLDVQLIRRARLQVRTGPATASVERRDKAKVG